jgi:glycosyltransferase involved in cell wall biosynthesis
MKFTVGIPAYKASYLRECINSILAQTYTDFELIILNDASPEDLDEIVGSYHSPSIRYYKNEKNFGAENVVGNWNKCLSYAEGEYFILMGDDDKMCPDYLEEFSALIKQFPLCNIYHCRAYTIDERSALIDLTEPRPEFESVYDSMLQRIQNKRHFFISDHVFKTATLKANGGFFKLPLAWASDDISAYIAAEEHGIAHTNKPVFMYRQNPRNITSIGNIYLKMEAILEEEKWLRTFIEREPLNEVDKLLKENIRSELKKFVQKKKIRTIYSSVDNAFLAFFKWFSVRKKYQISTQELVYALVLSFKEKRKAIYK